VVRIAREEIQRIMGLDARPKFVNIARWPKSMAQYTVGHGERQKLVEARVAANPRLHLAGNAYYGIGIPDCVRMGREAARRIAGGASAR
jgi:oxygen-dependent protoporphyrinogen oxidase